MVVFVLGFGALGILFTRRGVILRVGRAPEKRRPLLRTTLPLFLDSLMYFALHRAAALIPKTGACVLHFDQRIFPTLALYWKWMVLPTNWPAIGIGRHGASAMVAVLSVGFAVCRYRVPSQRIYPDSFWFSPISDYARVPVAAFGALVPLLVWRQKAIIRTAVTDEINKRYRAHSVFLAEGETACI